jgi:hypothetical protein
MLRDNTSNPATTSSPVVAQEPAKKKGGKTALIAIIALLVGGAIASGVFVAIKFLNNDPKNNQTANCDKNTIDNIEIEPIKDDDGNNVPDKGIILDARLTAELAYKTNRILANTPSSERAVTMDTTGDFKDYQNLSDQMRADIILGNKTNPVARLDGGKEMNVSDLPDSFKDKSALIKDGFKKVDIIEIDNMVKSEYKYLFDKEFTNFPDTITSDFSTDSCGATYSKDGGYYVIFSQCGGGTSIGHSSYQYKYELDGDKAYVYLAIMSTNMNDESVYSGFYEEKKALNLSADNKKDFAYYGAGGEYYNAATGKSELIYKKLQHYRAVFEKGSDNDFYYKTLEKVND